MIEINEPYNYSTTVIIKPFDRNKQYLACMRDAIIRKQIIGFFSLCNKLDRPVSRLLIEKQEICDNNLFSNQYTAIRVSLNDKHLYTFSDTFVFYEFDIHTKHIVNKSCHIDLNIRNKIAKKLWTLIRPGSQHILLNSRKNLIMFEMQDNIYVPIEDDYILSKYERISKNPSLFKLYCELNKYTQHTNVYLLWALVHFINKPSGHFVNLIKYRTKHITHARGSYIKKQILKKLASNGIKTVAVDNPDILLIAKLDENKLKAIIFDGTLIYQNIYNIREKIINCFRYAFTEQKARKLIANDFVNASHVTNTTLHLIAMHAMDYIKDKPQYQWLIKKIGDKIWERL